jgi:membrane protease YdiL (CAAX protease family)
MGFFSLPKEKNPNAGIISFDIFLAGFALFLSVQLVLVPLVVTLFHLTHMKGVITLIGMGLTLLALILFVIFFWDRISFLFRLSHFSVDVAFGVFAWFLSYPLVMAVVLILESIITLFSDTPLDDQMAVKQLKLSMENPSLFWPLALFIVCLVPFMEEFLFRGLLQSWLTLKVGVFWSICTTSIVFALFHYSGDQQLLNIPLISSLFILSCFLGFLFERQRTLWAPIALHVSFNLVSVMMIILFGGDG